MKYRKLGRTGLDVSVIGLGAEYLWDFSLGKPATLETVTSVVDEAVGNGVNYIDVPLPAPGVRKNLGIAFQGRLSTIRPDEQQQYTDFL